MDDTKDIDVERIRREMHAMMWHPIEDLRNYCCIMPSTMGATQPQHGQPQPISTRCNQVATCLVCAAFAQKDLKFIHLKNIL